MYVNKEIQHAQDRIAGLRGWLLVRPYTHPEYDRYVRDLHIAEVKLAQLTQPRMTSAIAEYSVPTTRK